MDAIDTGIALAAGMIAHDIFQLLVGLPIVILFVLIYLKLK